jgi:hypothetical protein
MKERKVWKEKGKKATRKTGINDRTNLRKAGRLREKKGINEGNKRRGKGKTKTEV